MRLAAHAAIALAATVEPVASTLAEEQVVALPAEESVESLSAKQAVGSTLAMDDVCSGAAVEPVGPAVSQEGVSPAVAADDVLAAACRDDIVAFAADDHIPARARPNVVCAFGSDLVGTNAVALRHRLTGRCRTATEDRQSRPHDQGRHKRRRDSPPLSHFSLSRPQRASWCTESQASHSKPVGVNPSRRGSPARGRVASPGSWQRLDAVRACSARGRASLGVTSG